MTNREIVDRALECFSDPSRREQYFDLYAENIVLHGYDGVQPGLDSVKAYYAGFWSFFPDARIDAEDILEQGDSVVVRFVVTGTQLGPILGIPPTGKVVHFPGITILRFQNQKCVERWSIVDSLSLLAQIGGCSAATGTA